MYFHEPFLIFVTTGRDRRDGSSAWSAGRRWRWDLRQVIICLSMGERHRRNGVQNLGHGGRTVDISYDLYGQGRSVELTVGGMPRPSGNEDGDVVPFNIFNVLDTMVIMEEGSTTHPRRTRLQILVPRKALKGRHSATAQCTRGVELNRRRLVEVDLRESSERGFEAYGEPLENVTVFRYLGQVLTAGYIEWLAVLGNHGMARKSWGRISRILNLEGSDPKLSGHFYKLVSQALLLFGAETWVLRGLDLGYVANCYVAILLITAPPFPPAT